MSGRDEEIEREQYHQQPAGRQPRHRHGFHLPIPIPKRV